MELDSEAIAEFCQKHHITRMRSYPNPHRTAAQREKAPEFLVDFEPGHIPGYFDMFGGPGLLGMEEELALLLGKEEAYLILYRTQPVFTPERLGWLALARENLYTRLPSKRDNPDGRPDSLGPYAGSVRVGLVGRRRPHPARP